MSDKEKNAGDDGTGAAAEDVPAEQPYLDEHTTEPNVSPQNQQAAAPAPAKWQMPKPKFQQTSGYLPQGYLKNLEQAPADEKNQPGSEDVTREPASPMPQEPVQTAPPSIEPQPDLDEALIADDPVSETPEVQTTSKRGSSLPVVAVGIVAILIFVAIFLAAVYFLFLATPTGNNNF